MRRLFALATMGLLGLSSSSFVEAENAIDIGSRRELFVDRLLISRLVGADLELKHPVPAGTAVRFDDPWEGPLAFYSTVFKDGDKYRLYYRGRYGGTERPAMLRVRMVFIGPNPSWAWFRLMALPKTASFLPRLASSARSSIADPAFRTRSATKQTLEVLRIPIA